VGENDVRRAYMHAAEFWNEHVEMMQVWADGGPSRQVYQR
jgi:hypothetical protein